MSVIIETTEGTMTIDLFCESCPKTCLNFLKLCKIKYYNNCLFFNVQQNFIAQTGDPTGTGKGGTSIFGKIEGPEKRFFGDEIDRKLKHTKMGTVAMANKKENMNGSQFYMTLRDNISFLDKKHTIFGQVVEGLDVLEKINDSFCNEKFRPYVDIRILHTIILDDPFDDPKGLVVPDHSPERTVPEEEVVPRGLTKDDLKDKNQGKSLEELEKEKKRLEAQSNAVILEMLGDLPDADVKPPENVLFVCQLNPITEDEDLKMIFFRFGVKSCEIIRDHTTGNSLGYAFIEFETEQGAVDAYYKMNNVLIDDRRIKVDFSQSVAKLWNRRRRGEVMTTYNGSTDRSTSHRREERNRSHRERSRSRSRHSHHRSHSRSHSHRSHRH